MNVLMNKGSPNPSRIRLSIPYRVQNSAKQKATTLSSCDKQYGPTYTVTRDTSMFLKRNQSRSLLLGRVSNYIRYKDNR